MLGKIAAHGSSENSGRISAGTMNPKITSISAVPSNNMLNARSCSARLGRVARPARSSNVAAAPEMGTSQFRI